MAICYHCGKGVMHGRSHTHKRGVAGGRWKKKAPKTRRLFRPNIQKATIVEKGKQRSVKLCAKCIKRIKKDVADKKKPFLQLINLKSSSYSQFSSTKDYKKFVFDQADYPKKLEEIKHLTVEK